MDDLAVTIGGASAEYRAGTLSLSGSLGSRTTCTFQTVDHPPFANVVEVGQVVEVRDGASALIFAGTVDSVEEEVDNSDKIRTKRIACVDYAQIADRHLVAYAYKPSEETPVITAGDVITDIVTRFFVYGGITEGIDTTAVEDGPEIEKLVFNYVPASQAFDEIAELAGYVWYIDYEKALHFTPKDRNTAPITLTATSANFRNLKITETRELYRNMQIVRAGTALTESRTDTVTAEADQKIFEVSFPVGTASAVTVNSVAKTLGVNGLHEGKDFYWSYNSQALTAAVAPGVGAVVAFTYQGLFPILVNEHLDAEILARRALEGGTGVYEAIADDPAINAQGMAVAKALAYLRKYGVVPQTVRFETDAGGLRPGQILTATVPAVGLDGDYLIESVSLRDVQGAVNRYQVAGVSGDALGGWLDWFTALARQTQRFVLYDEDQVGLLKTAEETVLVTDAAIEYDWGTVGRKPESRTNKAQTNFSETNWVH